LNKEEEKEAEQDSGAVYGADVEDESEEDDDSIIGGDLDSDSEEGEDEIEEELDDAELASLAK